MIKLRQLFLDSEITSKDALDLIYKLYYDFNYKNINEMTS